MCIVIVFFKQKTAYEMRISDWSSDVCSSDLPVVPVEENGYIFGRGSEDNKFDIAMMVATMAQLKKEGFKPKRSIILLLSGDEETSMTTTRDRKSTRLNSSH